MKTGTWNTIDVTLQKIFPSCGTQGFDVRIHQCRVHQKHAVDKPQQNAQSPQPPTPALYEQTFERSWNVKESDHEDHFKSQSLILGLR